MDCKLAHYVNKLPLKMRSKLKFERESQGVYRYHRKRVFMKIEGDSIIIRVGGGYLTMDEFVQTYCSNGDDRARVQTMVEAHAQQHLDGDRKYKAFYLTS